MEASPAARHDLLTHMRDVLKAIRLFKNCPPPGHLPVPGGTLGVLAAINGSADGCHVKELAAWCALDPSTISRAVAALVRAGLVRRAADPTDGRASVLALTDHGQSVLGGVIGWYDDLLADALADWSAEDVTAFAGMLRRFSDDLLARVREPDPGSYAPSTTDQKTLEAAL